MVQNYNQCAASAAPNMGHLNSATAVEIRAALGSKQAVVLSAVHNSIAHTLERIEVAGLQTLPQQLAMVNTIIYACRKTAHSDS